MQSDERKKPKKWVILLVCGAACLMLLGFNSWRTRRWVAPSRAPDFFDRPVNNDLMKAIGANDLTKVRKLLDAGVSPDSTNGDKEEGCSALSSAAGGGEVQIVQLLLDRGADVNAEDMWGGNAITSASVWGYPDVVAILIHHGGDVNADDDGATALGYAEHGEADSKTDQERQRFESVVRQLRAAGASANPWFPLW